MARPLDTKRMKFTDQDIVTKSHDGKVSGSKGLKGTQTYPRGFGEATAELFLSNAANAALAPDPTSDTDDSDVLERDYPWNTDTWDDAELQHVVRDLEMPRCFLTLPQGF